MPLRQHGSPISQNTNRSELSTTAQQTTTNSNVQETKIQRPTTRSQSPNKRVSDQSTHIIVEAANKRNKERKETIDIDQEIVLEIPMTRSPNKHASENRQHTQTPDYIAFEDEDIIMQETSTTDSRLDEPPSSVNTASSRHKDHSWTRDQLRGGMVRRGKSPGGPRSKSHERPTIEKDKWIESTQPQNRHDYWESFHKQSLLSANKSRSMEAASERASSHGVAIGHDFGEDSPSNTSGRGPVKRRTLVQREIKSLGNSPRQLGPIFPAVSVDLANEQRTKTASPHMSGAVSKRSTPDSRDALRTSLGILRIPTEPKRSPSRRSLPPLDTPVLDTPIAIPKPALVPISVKAALPREIAHLTAVEVHKRSRSGMPIRQSTAITRSQTTLVKVARPVPVPYIDVPVPRPYNQAALLDSRKRLRSGLLKSDHPRGPPSKKKKRRTKKPNYNPNRFDSPLPEYPDDYYISEALFPSHEELMHLYGNCRINYRDVLGPKTAKAAQDTNQNHKIIQYPWGAKHDLEKAGTSVLADASSPTGKTPIAPPYIKDPQFWFTLHNRAVSAGVELHTRSPSKSIPPPTMTSHRTIDNAEFSASLPIQATDQRTATKGHAETLPLALDMTFSFDDYLVNPGETSGKTTPTLSHREHIRLNHRPLYDKESASTPARPSATFRESGKPKAVMLSCATTGCISTLSTMRFPSDVVNPVWYCETCELDFSKLSGYPMQNVAQFESDFDLSTIPSLSALSPRNIEIDNIQHTPRS